MSGTSAERQRVARVYTAARRHPWVLGKLGDWTVPFGPYTPAQLVVMGGGALLLIKTFTMWSWLGPVPVAGWLVGIWAARGAKIGGRSPFTAAFGWLALLAQHPAGRIAGRAARGRRPTVLSGQFVIEPAPAATPVPVRTARMLRRRPSAPAAAVRAVPVSGLAHLLQTAQRAQVGRS